MTRKEITVSNMDGSAETIVFTWAALMSVEDFGEKCILAKIIQQLLDRRDVAEKCVGEIV